MRTAETFRAAKRYGTVVIVTNAERGWIELTVQKFLPMLAPLLESIKIISARTTYESQNCRSPLEWKVRTFDEEILRFFGKAALDSELKVKNIISFGDGQHERQALMRTTQSLPSCRAKVLKFIERPLVSEILRQHRQIQGAFEWLVQCDATLDIDMSR